jgi:type IV secretion system protein VirD4
LILVSGVPPIRARKLRYYEDRNFIDRVSAAPTLSEEDYVDRPHPRPDDWTGQIRGMDVRLALQAERDTTRHENGGLGLEPALGRRAIKTPADPVPQGDLFEAPDTAEITKARSLSRIQRSATVVRAHAMNQGTHKTPNLLPEF